MSDAHSSDDVLPPPGNDLDGLFDDPPVLASEATISRPLAEPLSDDDDAGGLFGDDDDDDQRAQSPGLTKEELAHRQRLEYDEDGEDENMEVVKKQEAVAQVELANFGIPTTSKVWHARLPNFLSLQTQAFDEVMWEPEEIEEPAPSQSQEGPESTPGTLDTPGTPKTTVPDENVIRWRWVKDAQGNVVKESNARTVRWSDGSLSLQIGTELFDISASIDHSAVLSSSSSAPVPGTKNATPNAGLSTTDSSRAHGLTYLTAEHMYQGLIEAQASVYGTLTFRPTTLQSNTHRRLAGSIAGRYVKGRGIKIAELPEEDPEKKKAEREKAELDRAKKQKKREQAAAGGGSKRGKSARKQTRYSDGEDDEGDDVGGEAGYRSQPKRGRGGPLAQEDEEDEDDFIVQDESDGDDEGAGGKKPRKSKRPSPEYSEDEPDEMDAAEERMEQEERRRKERKKEQRDAPAPESSVAPRRRLVVDESDEE